MGLTVHSMRPLKIIGLIFGVGRFSGIIEGPGILIAIESAGRYNGNGPVFGC